MSAEALFLYGTLRHLPLLAVVAGGPQAHEPAVLADHCVTHAVSPGGAVQEFPLFTPRPGAEARGLLIRPDVAARARLDAYERVFGYDTTEVTVQTGQGPIVATIYLPQPGRWLPGQDWSLDRWAERRGAVVTEVAAEVMALIPGAPAEAILQRYGMLENRVHSRHRARALPTPATLRRTPGQGDVVSQATRRPYTWFFGIDEADLRFRRFDGSHSPVVTRAGFIMADAVTVLPYDPHRDSVMLVEQFRFGPYARGDGNPWSLEPIAGRIDPGETPEDAARREAREEARLDIRSLLPIARYYVSPGAVTEYLFSYVGLADLPETAQGVNGLDTEAEDIRAHIVPFARLMDLVQSSEAENGPLLVSALWLALNRDRLRASV